MLKLLPLIPLFPLISSVLLMVTIGKMPKRLVAILGAGSVGLSAITTLLVGLAFMESGQPYHQV